MTILIIYSICHQCHHLLNIHNQMYLTLILILIIGKAQIHKSKELNTSYLIAIVACVISIIIFGLSTVKMSIKLTFSNEPRLNVNIPTERPYLTSYLMAIVMLVTNAPFTTSKRNNMPKSLTSKNRGQGWRKILTCIRRLKIFDSILVIFKHF